MLLKKLLFILLISIFFTPSDLSARNSTGPSETEFAATDPSVSQQNALERSATSPSHENPVLSIEISDDWEFSEAGEDEWMPASVPGTVHNDLMDNNVIDDPHYRLNENDVQWIENRDWEYRTTFRVDSNLLESDRVELRFEGLDTYAEVRLNDHLILESENMFVGHTVEIHEYVTAGENELHILFHSPVSQGMEMREQIDYHIPSTNEQAPQDERTSVFTRKAPFHYGWDWGPRLVTSGVWRPVLLEAWNSAQIDDLYLFTRYADEEHANVGGRAEIEVVEPGTYTLALNINGAESNPIETLEMSAGSNIIPFEVEIEDPKLWWTNGLGEPFLYDFKFTLTRENRNVDQKQLDFGVRTLRLVQEPDEIGRSFYFELNGVPVFMKGANVIPSETLTPSVSEQTYERLFENATAAHMNMLRVWGGAIYEEDLFYSMADQNGILIWQDFMFACNLQPGDPAHLDNIRQEAEYNVKRLRNHASIALWCGNNENLHGWYEWGWKEMYDPEVRNFMWRTYERIFHEILPDAVSHHDRDTPYWSSSPSSYGDKSADRKSGDEHDWTIWFGQQPFSAYGDNVPRFVSEYGMQAFPGMHTIREFSTQHDWDIDSEVMRHRQRGRMGYIEPGFDGNDMIKRYMGRYYQVPEDFEHFVYTSQIMHAKAYKTAIEAHRRSMPQTMGTLYWQLNDSWPTISWATVDYFGRWKAAHYAVRDAYEETIISPVIQDETIGVYAVSDRLETLEETSLTLTVMDFEGNELYQLQESVDVDANTSTLILEQDLEDFLTAVENRTGSDVNPASTVIKAVLASSGQRIADNLLYLNRPLNLDLPESGVSISGEKTEEGYLLSVSSDVLVKNLFLDTTDGDDFFTHNFFDLEPGTTKQIKLVTDREIDISREVSSMSLNDLKNP